MLRVALASAFSLSLAGCEIDTPRNIVTSLDAARWNGKPVIIKGIVQGESKGDWWITLADGTEVVLDPRPPAVLHGRTVSAAGHIHVSEFTQPPTDGQTNHSAGEDVVIYILNDAIYTVGK
jgi:hypothetical protein